MRLIVLGILLAIASGASAQGKKHQNNLLSAMSTEGFMAYHPDLRWRRDGLLAYNRGDYPEALRRLKKGAYFGDKPSQAMVADMYWRGIGVEQDRALAYAWIDLSAERLYPDMVAFRERYWAELTESERRDALMRGREVYALYGDTIAKPRQAVHLRRGLRKMTGSRTGFVGNLSIRMYRSDGTGFEMRGDEYYAQELWKPQRYWGLQDTMWKAPVRERVRVGDVEQVKTRPEEDRSPD
ncbi:hypothetical protein ASD77_06625 [Pseudoxanthomonas sp. Root65]|uniref:sel1 repeat family protein n=1 Tax=Pseudoxanthomonas sp. Root65 TaxID=1736576 RepID=UPI0007126BD6|nr:sel1 repeat family protein [Pseudoxanthomonas sp. Root65]KRA54287.1 hypothetical protein ASD77_06625 [Pseudoxanthomonas sp. Root65]